MKSNNFVAYDIDVEEIEIGKNILENSFLNT